MTNSATTTDISIPPHLTAGQIERLAYLSGELAEAISAAAKILRHGWHNYDPTNPKVTFDRDGDAHPDNQADLEKELGHVLAGIELLVKGGDLENISVHRSKDHKLGSVRRWLNHQGDLFA